MAAWSIAYGRTEEHATELRVGLARLGPTFQADVCGMCKGAGQYEQRYCDGPKGSFRMMGGCDYCAGTGLRQGRGAAPDSVREQVLNAARR
jgi:hypothetical protein